MEQKEINVILILLVFVSKINRGIVFCFWYSSVEPSRFPIVHFLYF